MRIIDINDVAIFREQGIAYGFQPNSNPIGLLVEAYACYKGSKQPDVVCQLCRIADGNRVKVRVIVYHVAQEYHAPQYVYSLHRIDFNKPYRLFSSEGSVHKALDYMKKQAQQWNQ